MGILASIESLYSISGFGLGFLIGMTEMGGGSLKTPLLILLFGIQLATAVGTDLLAIGMSRGTGHWRIAPRPVSAVILHKTECWPALQSQKPSNGKRRAEPVIWIGGPCLPAGFFLTVRQLASKRAGCGWRVLISYRPGEWRE